MMLFSRALRIDNARRAGPDGGLCRRRRRSPKPDKPLWIEPPLDVTVKDFLLADATIYRRERKARDRPAGGLERAVEGARTRHRIARRAAWRHRRAIWWCRGASRLEADTVRAALKARWKDVVVPENPGRPRAREPGRDRTSSGTPKAYAVKGELDVGPPNELVHVVIDASGTDARARICGSSNCGRAPGIWR